MTGPAYLLDDANLVRALYTINTSLPDHLRDWERGFASNLPTAFARQGRLTWKQRRAARITLDRVAGALAKLHGRPDLWPDHPAPTYQPPRLLPPPPPEPPPDPEAILARLSPGQRQVLLALADGEWHRTGARTEAGRVAGASVPKLARLRLVDRELGPRPAYQPKARITALGKLLLPLLATSERTA